MLRVISVLIVFALMSVSMFAAADDNEEANKLVEEITRLEKIYDAKIAERKPLVVDRDKYQKEADDLSTRITLLQKKIEETKREIANAETEAERKNWEQLLEFFQRRLLEILGEYKEALKERDALDRQIKPLDAEISGLHSKIMDLYDQLEDLLGLNS